MSWLYRGVTDLERGKKWPPSSEIGLIRVATIYTLYVYTHIHVLRDIKMKMLGRGRAEVRWQWSISSMLWKIYTSIFFLIFTCFPPSSEQGCHPHQSTEPFPRKRSQSLQSKWKLLLFSWGVTSSAFLLWSEVDQTRQLCSVPLLSKMKKGGWWPNYLSHSSGLSLVECLVSPSI